MMLNHPALSLAQIVGYIAAIIHIGAYSSTRDDLFKKATTTSSIIWACHYALLSGWTPAFVALLSATRKMISLFPISQMRFAVSSLYVILFSVILYTTWEGWSSLIPWIIGINTTYALFWLGGIEMRVQMILSLILWLVNAIIFGSIGHIITCVVTITIGMVTIYRMCTLNKFEKLPTVITRITKWINAWRSEPPQQPMYSNKQLPITVTNLITCIQRF